MDIEDSEGFEAHYANLKAWRLRQEYRANQRFEIELRSKVMHRAGELERGA